MAKQLELNLKNGEHSAMAHMLANSMVESVKYPDRRKWLTDRGWTFYSGKYSKADSQHVWLKNGGSVNQTMAMHIAAWEILDRKGIVK